MFLLHTNFKLNNGNFTAQEQTRVLNEAIQDIIMRKRFDLYEEAGNLGYETVSAPFDVLYALFHKYSNICISSKEYLKICLKLKELLLVLTIEIVW